jgi:hypothetical protein
MSGGGIKSCGGNVSSRELQTENGEHRVVDEGPGGVAEWFILVDAEVTDEVVEDSVRLLELQIETKGFQEQVLVVQDRVSPFPEFLGLLVHDQVGLFLCYSAARNHELSHPPNILLHFCC